MISDLSTNIQNCIYNGILPRLRIDFTYRKYDESGAVTTRTIMSGAHFQIREGSATRKTGCAGEFGTPVGACDIGTFEFEVFNNKNWQIYGVTFPEATFNAYLFYEWYEGDVKKSETLEWGKYTVVAHELTANGAGIIIRGYDSMAQLDLEEFDFNTKYADKSVVYGGEVLLDVLDGLRIAESSYTQSKWLNSTTHEPYTDRQYMVWKSTYDRHGQNMPWPDIPVITKREALMYILQLKGEYAFVDGKGQVVIRGTDYGVWNQRRVTLQATAGQAPKNSAFPYFEQSVSPVMLSGVEFSNPILESEETVLYGDRSAAYATYSNPFFIDNYPMNGNTKDGTFFYTRYYMSGSLTLLSGPFEPGQIIEDQRNKWNNMPVDGGSGFMTTSIVWKDKSTTTSLYCDISPSDFIDIRKAPEKSEPIPDIFQTGTITLQSGPSSHPDTAGMYFGYILLNRVPARYLDTYVVIATPTDGGTVTKIQRTTGSCIVFGDTQNMRVSYQLCKPTDSNTSDTNSVTTNYGALAQNYLSTLEESYTS